MAVEVKYSLEEELDNGPKTFKKKSFNVKSCSSQVWILE